MAETREIRQRILDECARQYDSVRFTHEFGKWIGRGISASRIAISSIPADLPPLEFLRRCLAILESVRAAEDNPNDEDGWTGGGISTIARFVIQERLAIERAGASTREGIEQAVDEAVRAAMPDRHEVLGRQVSILLLDPLEPAEPTRGSCSWCRRETQTHRFDSMRSICRSCALLFHANLAEAAHGKQIPEIGMVIADVRRALNAANEPAAERIIAELERRASARRSRYPRGFLPSCDGCSQAFERCRWTASLPGIDLCDACVKRATEILTFA